MFPEGFLVILIFTFCNKNLKHYCWLQLSTHTTVSHTKTKTHTYLVSCQDPEGCYNLLSCVCVSSLSGHKVNERLEGDDSSCIGIHQHHYTGKLYLPL